MQSDTIKAKSDSNKAMFTELTSITVRNITIKVGDTSDYAFSIPKPADRIKGPDIERNDKLSIKPVVTQHYEVDGKVIDIMIVFLKQNESYRVGKILLVNKEPVVNPIAHSEKKGTEWSVPENIPKYKIAAKCGHL
jgi:hypothetical protein